MIINIAIFTYNIYVSLINKILKIRLHFMKKYILYKYKDVIEYWEQPKDYWKSSIRYIYCKDNKPCRKEEAINCQPIEMIASWKFPYKYNKVKYLNYCKTILIERPNSSININF